VDWVGECRYFLNSDSERWDEGMWYKNLKVCYRYGLVFRSSYNAFPSRLESYRGAECPFVYLALDRPSVDIDKAVQIVTP
jgi:hypothetical protein